MKKKILLIFILMISFARAQSDIYTSIGSDGSISSPNGRAPQGSKNYNRSIWLITASEMLTAGFPNGSIINSLGFKYILAQNIPTTGTFVVYLQNTTDTANNKSTVWSTAISTMTTVSNSNITIPAAIGTVDFPFVNGTGFTYTGGGIYVAFDYQNTGTVATTGNTASCNLALTNGLISQTDLIAPPANVVSSNYRPETRLGVPTSCTRPTDLSATNITQNTAQFNWNSNANVTIQWCISSFSLGSGTTVNDVSSPYDISGLISGTAYKYYVKKLCSGGTSSAWQGPYTFLTQFSAVDIPYSTGFDEADTVNGPTYIGWSNPNSSNLSSNWKLYKPTTPDAFIHQGTTTAYSYSNNITVTDSWLFSRGINLVAGTPVAIDFYARNYSSTTPVATNAASKFKVTIGTAPIAAGQTTIVGTENNFSSSAFILKHYFFTPTTSGIYYIGIQHNSPVNTSGTQGLFVDTFSATQDLNVSDFTADNFLVFPNPMTNNLFIGNPKQEPISMFEITDLNGRVVYQKNSDFEKEININISSLAAGIYFLTIKSNTIHFTKKLIKE